MAKNSTVARGEPQDIVGVRAMVQILLVCLEPLGVTQLPLIVGAEGSHTMFTLQPSFFNYFKVYTRVRPRIMAGRISNLAGL